MVWLFLIGALHYALLWSGDILMQLAIAGVIALRFVRLQQLPLLVWGIGLVLLQTAINLAHVLPPFWLRSGAAATNSFHSIV